MPTAIYRGTEYQVYHLWLYGTDTFYECNEDSQILLTALPEADQLVDEPNWLMINVLGTFRKDEMIKEPEVRNGIIVPTSHDIMRKFNLKFLPFRFNLEEWKYNQIMNIFRKNTILISQNGTPENDLLEYHFPVYMNDLDAALQIERFSQESEWKDYGALELEMVIQQKLPNRGLQDG